MIGLLRFRTISKEGEFSSLREPLEVSLDSGRAAMLIFLLVIWSRMGLLLVIVHFLVLVGETWSLPLSKMIRGGPSLRQLGGSYNPSTVSIRVFPQKSSLGMDYGYTRLPIHHDLNLVLTGWVESNSEHGMWYIFVFLYAKVAVMKS